MKKNIQHPLTADEVVKILKTQIGQPFKANWTGAWDRVDCGSCRVVTINRGKGFEQAVIVSLPVSSGKMIYFPPFLLENMPSSEELLLFYCNDGLYLE